jgi:hypothetical protein
MGLKEPILAMFTTPEISGLARLDILPPYYSENMSITSAGFRAIVIMPW